MSLSTIPSHSSLFPLSESPLTIVRIDDPRDIYKRFPQARSVLEDWMGKAKVLSQMAEQEGLLDAKDRYQKARCVAENILLQFNLFSQNTRMIERMIRRESPMLYLVTQDREANMQGICVLHGHGKESSNQRALELEFLLVNPENICTSMSQRLSRKVAHVGKTLLVNTEAVALEFGKSEISLTAFDSSRSFYSQFGYEPVFQPKDEGGNVRMRKSLIVARPSGQETFVERLFAESA